MSETSISEKANKVMNRFSEQLALLLGEDGATLVRILDWHSDRGFRILSDTRTVTFFAKISQTEMGFWGLGIDRANDMVATKQPLVLLTSANDGYFIPVVRLEKLLDRFSQDAIGRDYKINESKIKKEWRFRSLEELWEKLREKLI